MTNIITSDHTFINSPEQISQRKISQTEWDLQDRILNDALLAKKGGQSLNQRAEYSCAFRPRIASNSKWTVVGGGAFVGMITALAIGLIFGPIAAAICFCLASIGSALHAAFAVKQCKNMLSTPPKNVDPLHYSTEDQIHLRRNHEEVRRIQQSW